MLNRAVREGTQETPEIKTLRSFTNKHRPTLAKYSIIALNLVADSTRCLRDVLLIELHPRPESRRTETSFYVIDASVVSLEEFEKAEEMREQLRVANVEQQNAGLLGSLFVVLSSTLPTCKLMNITAVGFGRTSLSRLRPGLPWKDELKRMLNEGIVI